MRTYCEPAHTACGMELLVAPNVRGCNIFFSAFGRFVPLSLLEFGGDLLPVNSMCEHLTPDQNLPGLASVVLAVRLLLYKLTELPTTTVATLIFRTLPLVLGHSFSRNSDAENMFYSFGGRVGPGRSSQVDLYSQQSAHRARSTLAAWSFRSRSSESQQHRH